MYINYTCDDTTEHIVQCCDITKLQNACNTVLWLNVIETWYTCIEFWHYNSKCNTVQLLVYKVNNKYRGIVLGKYLYMYDVLRCCDLIVEHQTLSHDFM